MKNMQNSIPYLHAGDRVALVAPARAVSEEELAPAIKRLSEWGLEVVIPDGLYAREHQLAGSDAHRAHLLQQQLDDPSLRAIICCRGGYGTVRIIDMIDFSRFAAHPKWIVGYSDATVLHSHIHQHCGLPTLHATMPINFSSPTPSCAITPAEESLRRALFGDPLEYRWRTPMAASSPIRLEDVQIVGGNLSILYSLLGSPSQIDARGKVLLIEDLDEYLYHIDRMMQALRRAGQLAGVQALLVGGMTDMHDNAIPFGRTAEEIILNVASKEGIPVLFNAPFGHLGSANLALPLGTSMTLTVEGQEACLHKD